MSIVNNSKWRLLIESIKSLMKLDNLINVDEILMLMKYYGWWNIMGNEILWVMKYYGWWNIMGNEILWVMKYYA